MGFLDILHRMAKGEPPFQPEPDKHAEQQPKTPDGVPQGTPVTEDGQKIIPVVRIERTEAHLSGDHMTVRCEIRNESRLELELDKIRVLGSVRELDTRLRPHESRDFIVYQGKRPNNRSNGVAELNYKDLLGDYFQARCAVEFRQEPDNTFSIYRITLAGPIKDIQ